MTASSSPEYRYSRFASSGVLLFRAGGVPVFLAPSWWLGSAIVVVLYAPLVERLLPGASVAVSWLEAAAFAVLLGVSVLAHELGHCLVALRLGVPVRRIRLFLLGGIAEVARNPRQPGQEGAIAAAGPIVSILLAGLCSVLLFMVPEGAAWLLVAECAAANLVVGLFNLLPGLPLDGGRMLRAAVWAGTRDRGKGTRAAVGGGAVVAAALVVWSCWGLLSGSEDRWLRLGVCLFTAWFIFTGANAERTADARQSLSGALSLESLLRPMVQLPSEVTVADALAAASGRAMMLVRPDGVAAGLVDSVAAERLAAVSPTSAAELVAEAIRPEIVVLLSDPGEEVVDRVSETAAWQFLVVDEEGRPAGVLHREDLRRALEGPRYPG